MTRINTVSPADLTDTHLIAEWSEAPRALYKAHARFTSEAGLPMIPDTYCLGRGHETFFFNKCNYLLERLNCIAAEMQRRGMNVNMAKLNEYAKLVNELPMEYRGVWQPSPEDKYLSMARLVKRSDIPAAIVEVLSRD